jgi:integrase
MGSAQMPKFTDRFLAGLRLESGRKDRLVFDSECRGLGVRVTPRTRVFLVQWHDPATRRKIREPLGPWGAITIDQARDAARVKLGAVARGIDPRAERLQARRRAERERSELALSFNALIEEWQTLHLAQRRPRYAAEAVRAIRVGLPELLKRPAARIGRAEAVSALDRIVKAGKAAMAGRTMSYARACFAWAKRRGKVPENPFAELPIPAAVTQRERVLTDGEIAAVWAAAGSLGYPWAPFFRLAMLTLQRRDEIAGMRWTEIAPDFRLWTLPGSRMKNGKPHDVHLSEAAAQILREIPRVQGRELVFTTTGATPVSGFARARRSLDAAVVRARVDNGCKSEQLAEWRLHDLRRTGVSTLARLGFDSIVVDKLLAHQPAKLLGVAAVYQRHDFARERAAALDAWAAHVTGIEATNVVQLHAGVAQRGAGTAQPKLGAHVKATS